MRYRRLTGCKRAATVTAIRAALVGAVLCGAALCGPAPATAAERHGVPERRDTVREEQWHLRTLDVGAAWRVSTGKGVTVAVVDSGVDSHHVDLAGQVLPGRDLVSLGRDGRTDPVGHGTTVAALIAGLADADGVVGIAPEAKILPVRVLNDENRYDDAATVAEAVRWAVDHGARVVNLSLGGNGASPALAAALDYAFTKDVVVIACTGNIATTGPGSVWYPAREPGVLAVAGLEDDARTLWSGSITGEPTVVSAPATGLVGARPGGYWRVQGTSFSAPMVSATAALIRSRWPAMSAANVVNRIIRTARDLGPAGRDAQFGFGMVDPVAALTTSVPSVAVNPLDTAPAPGESGFGTAPGLEQRAAAAPGAQIDAGGPASGAQAAWAAAPAGGGGQSTEQPWLRIALTMLMLALGVLMIYRRLSRPH